MLASVIIPVYNDGSGLRCCLRALAAQTLPRDQFEVIVVDNGSESPLDATTLRAQQPQLRIRVVRCDTRGSYAARNAGTDAADGFILLFLDADCFADRHWIKVAVERLTGEDEHLVVGGDVRFVAPARPTSTARYQLVTGFRQRENIEERGFSATANLAVRAATFAHIGPFSEQLLSAGDREWCWRAKALGVRTEFCAEMSVSTIPRSSLRAAIVQARRVTGGRAQLRLRVGDRISPPGLSAALGPWASVRLILSSRNGSWWQRVQVLAVAIVIRLARAVEALRLKLGGQPERR